MTAYICVNFGSNNVFLPDGTKPIPESVLTYYYYSPESSATASVQTTILYNEVENYAVKITSASPRGQKG